MPRRIEIEGDRPHIRELNTALGQGEMFERPQVQFQIWLNHLMRKGKITTFEINSKSCDEKLLIR